MKREITTRGGRGRTNIDDMSFVFSNLLLRNTCAYMKRANCSIVLGGGNEVFLEYSNLLSVDPIQPAPFISLIIVLIQMEL